MGQNEELTMYSNTRIRLSKILKSHTQYFVKYVNAVKEKGYEVKLSLECFLAMISVPTLTGISQQSTKVDYEKYYIRNNKSYSSYEPLFPKKINIYFTTSGKSVNDLLIDVFNVYYATTNDNVSMHAIVNPDDGKIYQLLPWNYKGTHSFDELDNSCIGILVCRADEPSLDEKAMKTTFYTLVALAAGLCAKYDIDFNTGSVNLIDENGMISDLSEYLGGYFSKVDFYSEVQKQVKNGLTLETVMNNYYAK